MRTSRNYYEILGLPRNASAAQIKRRFRELVRKHHPDVARDKTTAHRLFIQINEAYEVLSDADRRKAYDEKLDMEAAAARSYAAPPRSSTQTQSRPKPPQGPLPTAAQLLKEAQFAFIQKRFGDAVNRCRDALRVDPRSSRAHAILGDIYRSQGKLNTAAKYYSFAIQLNPLDVETQNKLLKLMDQRVKSDHRREVVVDPRRRQVVNAVWWGIAFLLIMFIGLYPGEPIPWLRQYIPQVYTWSWNLIGFIAGASAITGALLSVNGFLSHPDDELVFDTSAGGWAIVPTGFILLIGSGFFFVGAAAFYVAIGFVQGSLSRSVLRVFAGVACVVILSALMYPLDKQQVLMYGGNVAFLSSLFGWYTGAALKPLSAE